MNSPEIINVSAWLWVPALIFIITLGAGVIASVVDWLR